MADDWKPGADAAAGRGDPAAERNMLRTVTGAFGRLGRSTWFSLQRVLSFAD